MAGVASSARRPDLIERYVSDTAPSLQMTSTQGISSRQQRNLRRMLNLPNKPTFPARKGRSTSPRATDLATCRISARLPDANQFARFASLPGLPADNWSSHSKPQLLLFSPYLGWVPVAVEHQKSPSVYSCQRESARPTKAGSFIGIAGQPLHSARSAVELFRSQNIALRPA